MREDSRPTNFEPDAQVEQSSEHDGAIQEVEILPLQAEDTSEEAMRMMQTEQSTDRAPIPQEDNAMLFGGSVLLALLLVAVVSYLITRRNRDSAKKSSTQDKSSVAEKKNETKYRE